MKIETKDYTVEIKHIGNGWCEISGDEQSLQTVLDTVVLSGAEEGTGVMPIPNGLRAHEGTVALWLQFEVLNFLDYEV